MMKSVLSLLCVLTLALALDNSFDVTVENGKPFITSLTPANLYGDVTVDVVGGKIDKTLILCLQELTNPPFRNRFSECTISLELAATPSTTGTSTTGTTTGAATTGAATTGAATTGAATTGDVTTGAATTGAVTTGAATTGAVTTGAATTGAVTTGAATTGAATTGAATTGDVTTGAATTGAATTGDVTTSTTGAATTAATTGDATTAAVTTGAATTAATTGDATTAAVTTGAVTTAATTGDATTTGATTTGTTTSSAIGKRSVSFTTNPHMVSLRNVQYSVAVYYKTEPAEDAEDKQEFTLRFSGLSCNETDKTGPNCDQKIKTWINNQTAEYKEGSMNYYSLTAPQGLNTVTFTTVSEFKITARYGAVPYGENFDAELTGNTLTVPSPAAGPWFFILTPSKDQNGTLGVKAAQCNPGMVGAGCASSVNTFNSTNSHSISTLNASQIVYYAVEGSLNSLLFSARTVEKSDKQPKLFAGWNRSPQFDENHKIIAGTFDLSGCNVESCQVLNQLNLRDSTTLTAGNGTWYVAVQAQEEGEVLIWGEYVCPNNCTEGHGTCQKSGEDYGVCQCQPSYAADLLCSEADFLVEYIILIVIAALVAISAIIGLVAWAYMKSKHRGYEPV